MRKGRAGRAVLPGAEGSQEMTGRGVRPVLPRPRLSGAGPGGRSLEEAGSSVNEGCISLTDRDLPVTIPPGEPVISRNPVVE